MFQLTFVLVVLSAIAMAVFGAIVYFGLVWGESLYLALKLGSKKTLDVLKRGGNRQN